MGTRTGGNVMLLRTAGGVLLGLALWWLLFFAFGIGIGLLWPPYSDAARAMMQERTFQLFTTSMLFTNYLVFAAAGALAGRVSAVMARKSAVVVTVILFAYAGIQHYVLLWNQLPDWYNVTIPIVIAGSVWLGGRFAKGRARPG